MKKYISNAFCNTKENEPVMNVLLSRSSESKLSDNQYEIIAEETLQSLTDKFETIGEITDCDSEYDVSYGVSTLFVTKQTVNLTIMCSMW